MKRVLCALAAVALLVLQVAPPAIAAYNFPSAIGQFSGDCATPSANSYATTCSKFNGGTSFGSMAGQPASNVAITGGSVALGTGAISGGAGTFTGTMTSAGQVAGFRSVTAAGAVTLAVTDYIVCINKTTGAATTVGGPSSPVAGQIFVLKDCKGDAATNNITFTPASGNVDGSASVVLNQPYQAVNLVYNGTQFNAF